MKIFRSSLIWFALVTPGCGVVEDMEQAAAPTHIPADAIHPDFVEALAQFYADGAAHGRLVPEPDSMRILYGIPEEKEAAGACQKRHVYRHLSQARYNIRSIVVHPHFAESPGTLRRILYHELGHCLLGLSHDDAVSAHSIMASRFGSFSIVEESWEELVTELFASI